MSFMPATLGTVRHGALGTVNADAVALAGGVVGGFGGAFVGGALTVGALIVATPRGMAPALGWSLTGVGALVGAALGAAAGVAVARHMVPSTQ